MPGGYAKPGTSVGNEDWTKKQHGLEGMKRRAHDIGASFSIRSAPGKGTTLTIEATQRKNRPEENKARSAQTSSAQSPWTRTQERKP